VELLGGEGSSAVASFLGQHRYQMDAKGRIALPSKFHDAFGKTMFLILGRDAGLWAYADEDWQRVTDQIRSDPLSTPEELDRARAIYGNADLVNVDKQGRVVIPQFLREQAHLDREVVVVGVSDHLEIWPAPGWDRREQAVARHYVVGERRAERQGSKRGKGGTR
jgi:transcriptional regulator MraZ